MRIDNSFLISIPGISSFFNRINSKKKKKDGENKKEDNCVKKERKG